MNHHSPNTDTAHISRQNTQSNKCNIVTTRVWLIVINSLHVGPTCKYWANIGLKVGHYSAVVARRCLWTHSSLLIRCVVLLTSCINVLRLFDHSFRRSEASMFKLKVNVIVLLNRAIKLCNSYQISALTA